VAAETRETNLRRWLDARPAPPRTAAQSEPLQSSLGGIAACTCATNLLSKGDELSFLQIRLNGSRTFISRTGSNTTPRGQSQRVDSVNQASPTQQISSSPVTHRKRRALRDRKRATTILWQTNSARAYRQSALSASQCGLIAPGRPPEWATLQPGITS
jgi:hypothetical protein